jgi:hypothetical protein
VNNPTNPWSTLGWVLGSSHDTLRTVVEHAQFYDWAFWTLQGARLQAGDPDSRAALTWALETLAALHMDYLARRFRGAPGRDRKPRPRSGGRAITIQ